MGNDVDSVLDDDDEDDDPFVDVSDAVEAERAKTTLLPRRHAKKGKTAPKLNTSEPDPSWSESEIELTEGDDEDDESPIETARTTLLPRHQAKRGQVTGLLSMEDDPDKVDESEPPFAVNSVSAAPQIPDFLKHPKVADTAVAALPRRLLLAMEERTMPPRIMRAKKRTALSFRRSKSCMQTLSPLLPRLRIRNWNRPPSHCSPRCLSLAVAHASSAGLPVPR